MSHPSDRREFFHEVGAGMLAVLVGPSVATQLGFAADAGDDKSKAPAGLARLADLVQQTPTARLLPALAEQLARGVSPRDLVAAGAVANARAFGGQDYNGYHTFMALCPSFAMALSLPEAERPLPVLKVLYRNSELIHGGGCEKADKLPAVEAAPKAGAEAVRDAARRKDVNAAEAAFAASKGTPEQDYDDLQLLVQDDLNVHRVVLAWRAWEVLGFTGKDHARAMLRQTVRFCADARHQNRDPHPIREVLPKLLDSHGLLTKAVGTRKGDDAWVQKLARTVYADKQATAAEAVAAALAEGFAPDSVGEALTLASTMLVLGDPGRPKAWSSPAKPEGSVHGDSVGVHASDAANAWRHIAAATSARNAFASLIAGAYHTAGQGGRQMAKPWPQAEDVEKVEGSGEERLLAALHEAVRGKDQRRACAVTAKYGAAGHDPRALFAALRAYAISEDGALHAEKYYQTASEEFGRGRPAFRWQHAVALARVSASCFGRPAAGVAEARKLLKV
ncbi:MAG: hypothetical protein ACRC33_27635 [Gemmataceae bacterium]